MNTIIKRMEYIACYIRYAAYGLLTGVALGLVAFGRASR